MTDEEFEMLRRKVEGNRQAINELTDTVEAELEILEIHSKRLDSIEQMVQICIDQGKGFSARISTLEEKLDA